MPQDAFTIKYVTKELKSALEGGKISKIIQPDKDTLLLFIYTAKGTVKLEVCLSAKGCRINLTDFDLKAPQTAPNFCMLLRKHLQNAQITEINQIDSERIVYFDLDCVSEFEFLNFRLYIELMGKYSNAVLTKDGIIVGALKTTAIGDDAKRILFTGVKYSLPEPQDKIPPSDINKLKEVFKFISGDRAKFISDRVKGVAYSTALDMAETYGDDITAQNVYDYIFNEPPAPCVTYLNGEPNDFKVRAHDGEKHAYDSVLEAQTAYYAYVTAKANLENAKRKLLSALSSSIKKLEKRLAVINQKILDCNDIENVKLKGELITANIYAIHRGMDGFEAVNYYDENCKTVKIQLDKTLSPADNAQKYYKRYAKLKRTLASVTEQREETEQKLDYLNSILSHVNSAENLLDLKETEQELKELGLIKNAFNGKKKVPDISPFREYLCQGFKIISGRNNVQNDRLLKSISQNDIWLHTQGYHSSHVAIICDGREVPDEVLLTACEICAYYSDGRAGSKIPVDYTAKKFVKKPPKSNAGFVVYTDYKTVLADPNSHKELCVE